MISPLLRAVLLFLALAGLAAPASAGNGISVADPWARASVTATGAAYLTLENAGTEDDALVEVRSDVAEKIEIHDMTMDGMVMRMRQLDRLALPAGETVRLAPGGLAYHADPASRAAGRGRCRAVDAGLRDSERD